MMVGFQPNFPTLYSILWCRFFSLFYEIHFYIGPWPVEAFVSTFLGRVTAFSNSQSPPSFLEVFEVLIHFHFGFSSLLGILLLSIRFAWAAPWYPSQCNCCEGFESSFDYFYICTIVLWNRWYLRHLLPARLVLPRSVVSQILWSPFGTWLLTWVALKKRVFWLVTQWSSVLIGGLFKAISQSAR